jgi:putative transposase
VYALAPTPRQTGRFLSHAGASRFAYNWGIARIIDALDAYAAEKASGVEKPTTRLPSHFDLCKAWTAHKDDPEHGLGWVGENFSGTYQAALRDAHGAWQKFFKARKGGGGGGRTVGRPRWKRKGRARDSFQVHGTTLQVVDAKHIKIPKIGLVRVHESTAKLGRRLRRGTVTCPPCQGTGTVTTAAGEPGKCTPCKATGTVPAARLVRGTVSRDSKGRWSIALTVEVVREVRTGPSRRQRTGGTVGVDFGVRDLAVLSTGEVIPNPRYLQQGLAALRTAQQQLARREPGSKRREKASARVGRLHARVRHLRQDALHKTTTALIHSYERISVEGWDVQQVAHRGSKDIPKRLRADRNRALADTGIGMARYQLQSKAPWYGSTVVVAGKTEPTGRTCSGCGAVRATPVPPSHEDYACTSCGLRMPRRLNTARVLAGLAGHHDAPGSGESENARGGGVRPVPRQRDGQPPVRREARARPPSRDQTSAPGT